MNAFAFFIFIISIIVIAIGGSHAFLYFTFTHFFSLGDAGEYLLIAALVALPSLFIICMIIAHYWDTALVRAGYFISGIWLGLVTHLTLFWIFAWWVHAAGSVAGIDLPMRTLIYTTGAAAVVYTLYGIWNSVTPRVITIKVHIPNLPQAWRGKTAVQLSDLHLGLVFREKFFRKVMRMVRAIQPDIVCITGDIFDGTDGDLASHLAPLRDYLPPFGTYYVTGNHEVYLGVDRVKEILKDAPITVLEDEIEILHGMQIIGVGYSKRSLKKDLAETLDRIGFDPSLPSLLLYHEPEQIEEMAAKGITMQLSGHTHKGQLLPFALLTRLFYGPYHHGLYTKGNYTLYTSSGVGLWGPTVRTGSRSEIVVIQFE